MFAFWPHIKTRLQKFAYYFVKKGPLDFLRTFATHLPSKWALQYLYEVKVALPYIVMCKICAIAGDLFLSCISSSATRSDLDKVSDCVSVTQHSTHNLPSPPLCPLPPNPYHITSLLGELREYLIVVTEIEQHSSFCIYATVSAVY